MSSQLTITTPIGPLRLHLTNNQLTRIDMLCDDKTTSKDADTHPLHQELQAYFKNGHYRFQTPVSTQGTPFQQRVWQALTRIPPGTTLTYGELARQLGTSARAVGNACRANPTPIVVPCHRIVAKQGLGGFAGKTAGALTDIKQWLLAHEKKGT